MNESNKEIAEDIKQWWLKADGTGLPELKAKLIEALNTKDERIRELEKDNQILLGITDKKDLEFSRRSIERIKYLEAQLAVMNEAILKAREMVEFEGGHYEFLAEALTSLPSRSKALLKVLSEAECYFLGINLPVKEDFPQKYWYIVARIMEFRKALSNYRGDKTTSRRKDIGISINPDDGHFDG